MKKIVSLSYFTLLFAVTPALLADMWQEPDGCYRAALTAGYVFKNDCRFKDVYGHGVINIITADGCYYPWELWGIGVKVSYWHANGETAFLKQCSRLKEVPFTVYVCRRHNLDCGLQLYASLGGGFIWTHEESYLGCVDFYKGIGEVEVGLDYPVWRCLNVTGAVRYLFPPQCELDQRIDVGGVDLRAGLSFSF